MKCSKCDTDLTQEDEFCPECGTKVEKEKPQKEEKKHIEKEPHKKKKYLKEIIFSKKWIWIISVIVLLVIITIAAYNFTPRCGDGKITQGEDCSSCPKDVKCKSDETCQNGKCVSFCGNGNCDSNENKCSCPQDCGVCSGSTGTCKEYYCSGTNCATRTKDNCCGNGKCELGEICSTCEVDCGSCGIFSINEGYSNTRITAFGSNKFSIKGNNEVGVAIPTLTIPVSFIKEARGVTFSYSCIDISKEIYLYSKLDPNKPKKWLTGTSKDVSIQGYWGSGSASTFILTNRDDFGSEIEYISKGNARALLFFFVLPDYSLDMDCKIDVTSTEPPFRDKKDFNVIYTP